MLHHHDHRWLLPLLLWLSACSTVPPTTNTVLPTQCIGSLPAVPVGLTATTDAFLLQQALGRPGDGKLCQGQVLVAKAPLLLYRVWDRSKPSSLYGSWWSFAHPGNHREQYRRDNVICPQWSALDIVSVCQVKIGSHLVLGTGQSAICPDNSSLPASAVHQVYLPNNLQQQLIQVEHCSPGQSWPEP